MNGRRKPRQPRSCRNPVEHAILHASRFTEAEVAHLLAPLHPALTALRQGVATEHQWAQLASCSAISLSIERKGVVRGLHGHLHAADLALQQVQLRAMRTGAWRPTPLWFNELDAVSLLVQLYEFQVRKLSAGEYQQAFDHALAETRRVGGRVMEVTA